MSIVDMYGVWRRVYMDLCHGASPTLGVLNVYFEFPYRTLLLRRYILYVEIVPKRLT